eukprot:10637614-Alexandrium_andersonii.AAC.1
MPFSPERPEDRISCESERTLEARVLAAQMQLVPQRAISHECMHRSEMDSCSCSCRWHRCDAWRSELCIRTETGSSGGTRKPGHRRSSAELRLPRNQPGLQAFEA